MFLMDGLTFLTTPFSMALVLFTSSESLDTSYDKKPVQHLDSSGEIYNTLLENAYIAPVR